MKILNKSIILNYLKTEFGEIFCWEQKQSRAEIQQLGKRFFEKDSVVRFLNLQGYEINVVDYQDSGQPYLKDYPELFLSISHSDTFFAIYLSSQPCGIDIQVPFPKMENVYQLYVNTDEMHLIASVDNKHLIWCVKEAVFKKKGGKFKNLLLDFVVLSLDEVERIMLVKNPNGTEKFSFLILENFYLVYSI